MCGIAGYVGDHRPELLEPMCSAMAHRGPDDQGTWVGERVGLGHRRLAIIDPTPAGHQPMSAADGRVWISYNGEIYNFKDLKRELVSRGYEFRSGTDTEVLLYLYLEDGPDFLQKLNGMFAVAIWDDRKRSLLLARDHVGIKPLYYWRDQEKLFFASEIKALLEAPEIPRTVNYGQIPTYLTLLWVPGSETMLDGIMKLEPGERLIWEDGQVSRSRWFSLEYEPDYSVSKENWTQRVKDVFTKTVECQMVSDVPLGAFLSGGVDSSSIVAKMREAFPERDISCYSLQFDADDMERDQFAEDLPYAQTVADYLNVDLKTVGVDASSAELLPDLIYQLDEPDADPAIIPTYLITKLANADGTKVLLSGTGGDEVFFGYRSHLAYRLFELLDRVPAATPALDWASWLAGKRDPQGALARRLRKMASSSRVDGFERHIALVDWSGPATRKDLMSDQLLAALPHHHDPLRSVADSFERFQGEGALNRHTHVLAETFLASHNFLYTDKMSMANSVEVRVPFVDVDLMRLAAQIPEDIKLPGRTPKGLLKRAMADSLPQQVISRPKTGFMLPIRKWMSEDLAPVMHDYLAPARLKAEGLFNDKAVSRAIEQHTANHADHAYLLYALLTFEIWRSGYVS